MGGDGLGGVPNAQADDLGRRVGLQKGRAATGNLREEVAVGLRVGGWVGGYVVKRMGWIEGWDGWMKEQTHVPAHELAKVGVALHARHGQGPGRALGGGGHRGRGQEGRGEEGVGAAAAGGQQRSEGQEASAHHGSLSLWCCCMGMDERVSKGADCHGRSKESVFL